MNLEIKTLELAKLYERQGHYHDALDMYEALYQEEPTDQFQDDIQRMRDKLESMGPVNLKMKISQLLEQWLKLVVLQHRLKKYKKIKSRLI